MAKCETCKPELKKGKRYEVWHTVENRKIDWAEGHFEPHIAEKVLKALNKSESDEPWEIRERDSPEYPSFAEQLVAKKKLEDAEDDSD